MTARAADEEKPVRVPNSPYPPAPPVVTGTTVTRPLNLRGAR